jgi:predicted methyltransferase
MFRRICKPFILLATALLLVSAASANPIAPSDSTVALLQKAVNGDWRSAAHKARDQYRHPIETLQFFGLKPDMTVIELQPGGGWYTEILAPVLYAHGHLLEATGPKVRRQDQG